MPTILGISAFYHDSAAAVVRDGQIIAAAQEERYTRIKHDPSFPLNAIEFCLSEAQITLADVDSVVFYDKPLLKFERLLETYLANAPRGFLSFVRAMPVWLKEKLYLKSVLRTELRHIIHRQRASENSTTVSVERQHQKKPKLPALMFCEHHQSHAAAAFYPSPYSQAAVLCLDGVGEWATSSAWLGNENQLSPLFEIHFPHSLGLLYSAFTQYCGFKVNSGEYKLMGLAPYGQAKYADVIKKHLVNIRADGSFSLDMQYFDYAAGASMTNQKFHALFDHAPFSADAPLSVMQMDLAKSIQVVTEEIVLKIVAHVYEHTQCENLCLAGGVALNCVANGRILRESQFTNVWIQPAAGDAGSALGCALEVYHQYFSQDRMLLKQIADSHAIDHMQGAYLGDSYSDVEIIEQCQAMGAQFEVLDEPSVIALTAELLEQGQVIGWFQGAMEFGPRALGNRSIIGDPRNTQMQSKMNLKIKQRESFRPFAPAVLANDVQEWFDIDCPSPYMLMVAAVKQQHHCALDEQLSGLDALAQVRSSVPAITHVDYSARVQTVHQHTNTKFHALLTAFKQRSGIGMVINTSFNVRGEPPVRSPLDALNGFLATQMDVLVMGNVVLYKKQQAPELIQQAQQRSFEAD